MSEGASRQRIGGGGRSAKWSTLRNAFLSAVESSKAREGGKGGLGACDKGTGGTTARSPRFEGFTLFLRHEEELPPVPAAPTTVEAPGGGLVLATYQLPGGRKVLTREAPSGRVAGSVKVTLDQLFAHRVHGVDNTGNVRVWPAEQVLLHLLLSSPLASSVAGCRVLELGAGMSGLAGLGLAACSRAAEVVITDGNPDALKTLETCVDLNAKEGVFGDTKVSARRLVWDSLDRNADRAALLGPSPDGGGRFDLIVASDCLFFKDFHDDLISTIESLLKPGGRAVLVQPQRGGTASLFMQRVVATGTAADAAGRLEARLLDRFDEKVWKMHQGYLRSGSGDGSSDTPSTCSPPTSSAPRPPVYLPDEHQPLLVEMIKTAVGGAQSGEATLAESAEPEPTDSKPSWIAWRPGAPYPPSTTVGGISATATKRASGGQNRDTGGGAGAGARDPAGSIDGAATKGASVLPSSQALGPDPPLRPPPPPPPPPPHESETEAAGEKQEEQRPDRRMSNVYEALAERLRLLVRERRAAAAATPEAGQAVGAGAVGDAGVEAEGGADGVGRGSAGGAPQRQQLWVAVAGAPGSGKTTLAAEVCKRLQSPELSAVCLPMDGYHHYRRELDLLPDPEQAHRRRGAHWTFDGRRFLREVAAARRTGRGSFPGFDHAEGDPVEDQWKVEPSHAVVIVEGNYLLLKGVEPWDDASALFDETWAIRCAPAVCGERVRERHVQTGLGREEARVRVESNDLPNALLVSERCPWGEVDLVIDSVYTPQEAAGKPLQPGARRSPSVEKKHLTIRFVSRRCTSRASVKMTRLLSVAMAVIALASATSPAAATSKNEKSLRGEASEHHVRKGGLWRKLTDKYDEKVYCDSFKCPWDYDPIKDAHKVECHDGKCEQDKCCEKKVVYCDSFKCPKDYDPIKDAHKVECHDGKCEQDKCCEKKVVYCDTFKCPKDYDPIKDAHQVECHDGKCEQDKCCEKKVVYCDTFKCPKDYDPIKDAHQVECHDGKCEQDKCCEKKVVYCDTFKCPKDYDPIKDAHQVECHDGKCEQDKCCEKKVVYCDSFKCPKDYDPIKDAHKVECHDGKCEQDKCCEKKKVYCDSFKCPKDYDPIKDAHQVECHDGKCEQDKCCEKKVVYCDSFKCPKDYDPIKDAHKVECLDGKCEQDKCCSTENGIHLPYLTNIQQPTIGNPRPHNLLRASATPTLGLAKAAPPPPPSPRTTTTRRALPWQARPSAQTIRRNQSYSSASTTALGAASEGGEHQEPTSADGEEDATETGDDGGEGARGRVEGGAESMELRDFRARLMSKGLDGWGAEGGDGGGREKSGGLDGADTVERWAHPLVRPELGCLIIAKEDQFTQQQQYFYKAVALVIQHGDDGTVALILNRPTTLTMGDVCTGDLLRVPGMEDNVLYMGGDVAGARDDGLDVVNLMHGREDVPAMEVVKGLRLGGLKEALDLIAKGEADPEEFKFFSRYSGWGPGQLEAEVLAGAWELAACDLSSVLQSHNHPDQPGHFWSEIMSRLRRHRGSGSTAAMPDT
eukprot:g14804.t2